jgi:hypothetical protein
MVASSRTLLSNLIVQYTAHAFVVQITNKLIKRLFTAVLLSNAHYYFPISFLVSSYIFHMWELVSSKTRT